MWPPEFHALVKREQYRDYLAVQAEARLAQVLLAEPRRDSALRLLPHRLAGRMAAPVGRALRRLGRGFVRVGAALEGYGSSGRL